MHILITVNAAWNVLHFRQALVVALIADGHRVTVLAPRNHSVTALEGLGIQGIHMLLMFAPVGILFTIFATVGVVNAFKLIDGLNGLSNAT